jgi:hypothetical protein
LTFHVKTGLEDPEFKRFEQYYQKCEEEIKFKRIKKPLVPAQQKGDGEE